MTRNILILDDDYDLALSWRSAFHEHGYKCDFSLTSSEAIAQADHLEYDLYVVDLMIPIGPEFVNDTGQTFLAHIAKKTGKKIPVIGVSGFEPNNDKNFARIIFESYGVNHSMAKPFQTEELVGLAQLLMTR